MLSWQFSPPRGMSCFAMCLRRACPDRFEVDANLHNMAFVLAMECLLLALVAAAACFPNPPPPAVVQITATTNS